MMTRRQLMQGALVALTCGLAGEERRLYYFAIEVPEFSGRESVRRFAGWVHSRIGGEIFRHPDGQTFFPIYGDDGRRARVMFYVLKECTESEAKRLWDGLHGKAIAA